ncbi:MAG: S24/S26 family peptidase [Clostridia bacterium]|nr:S24/S26 family peptidase [Clostridia bacterium]
MIKTVNMSMQDLSPLISSCVESGKEVVLTVTGNSMRPFIKDKRDQVILIKADKENLQVNDVPLYRRRNGKYVLHRLVKIENGKYTMLGDAQVRLEPGIEPDQIVAIAKGFIRKGKTYPCDSKEYKRYVSFWNKMMPLRKFYFLLKRAPKAVLIRIKRLAKKILSLFK